MLTYSRPAAQANHRLTLGVATARATSTLWNTWTTWLAQPAAPRLSASLSLRVLLAAAAIFIFTPKKAPTTQTPDRLYGTIVDTQKVTKDAGKRIKNNRLKSINSTLNASLVNASTNLEKPLGGLGVDTKKLRATVQKTEYHDQRLVDKLEDARLNAVYDRTYTTQMEYKVKDIQLNMQAISKAGTTKETNDAFKKIDTALNTVIKSLEEYRKSGAH